MNYTHYLDMDDEERAERFALDGIRPNIAVLPEDRRERVIETAKKIRQAVIDHDHDNDDAEYALALVMGEWNAP